MMQGTFKKWPERKDVPYHDIIQSTSNAVSESEPALSTLMQGWESESGSVDGGWGCFLAFVLSAPNFVGSSFDIFYVFLKS